MHANIYRLPSTLELSISGMHLTINLGSWNASKHQPFECPHWGIAFWDRTWHAAKQQSAERPHWGL